MVLLYLALLFFALAADPDYANQNTWTDPSCQTGTTQSPINLTGATDRTDVEILYNGSTWENLSLNSAVSYLWQYDVHPGRRSTITYRFKTAPNSGCQEARYTASQFHFHRTSEHTVGGTSYSAELHIVHQLDHKYASCSNMKSYLVIGVFFNLDSNAPDNAFLSTLNIGTSTAGSVDFAAHYPTWMTNGVYNYEGSLTTPNCAQVVQWVVAKTVQPMSQAQKTAFDSMGSGISNRAVQSNSNTLYSVAAEFVKKEEGEQHLKVWMVVVFLLLAAVLVAVVVMVTIACCRRKNQRRKLVPQDSRSFDEIKAP